jgi:hypothetical protein
MEWTKEQRAEIFNLTCQDRQAECPNDKSALKTRVLRRLSGFDVMADCPECGEHLMMSDDQDPRAAEFRAWTESEKGALFEQFSKQGPIRCPVDGSILHPVDGSSVQRSDVVIRCFRCGNSDRRERAR